MEKGKDLKKSMVIYSSSPQALNPSGTCSAGPLALPKPCALFTGGPRANTRGQPLERGIATTMAACAVKCVSRFFVMLRKPSPGS